MKLPGAKEAVLDVRKRTDYRLNSAHPSGRLKARMFAEGCRAHHGGCGDAYPITPLGKVLYAREGAAANGLS
jgi:hypothetical protein